MSEVPLSLEELRALCLEVLRGNGFEAQQAEPIADVIVRAEADACRSHGLYRLPGYVASVASGRANGRAEPKVTQPTSAIVRVDADKGFGPAASEAARPALIAAARRHGIAAMAMGNGHHFHALWADIEPLTDAGFACWAFVIGQLSVAPHGGTRKLMGTNPVSFGWPRRDAPAFIFDFATSMAARGEVELKRLAGEPLPAGWGIDPEGRPTTDPAMALAGAMLPFGGHKGSALSMMVELIAGPLIGEMTSQSVAEKVAIADSGPPPGGQLVIALDPAAFAPEALREAEAETFFANARSQPGLWLASDRRHAARAEAHRTGIRVPRDLMDRVRGLLA